MPRRATQLIEIECPEINASVGVEIVETVRMYRARAEEYRKFCIDHCAFFASAPLCSTLFPSELNPPLDACSINT